MGTSYTLHCEVMRNGIWENWDLYRFKNVGCYNVVPVAEGKSVIGGALKWYDLLSEKIQRDQISQKTLDAHPTEYPDDQDWRVFDYVKFFGEHDFSVPETSGYFAKDVLNFFRTEKDYSILDGAVQSCQGYLPPDEFAKLTPEAQKGFVFHEYTNPDNWHGVMRSIQQAVELRLAFTWWDGPVRIVILVS